VRNILTLLSKNIKTETIIILFGYETWSVPLREECRLNVFNNRVLRRIIGPLRDEVTGIEKAT
jgi:hypothetical protein